MTKKVSFNKNVYVSWYLHVNDISLKEARNTWYSSREVAKIKRNCFKVIARMNQGPVCNDDSTEDFCARGLEYRTKKGMQLRRKNKLNALDAVYNEQNRQWESGVLDVDSLARVYMECSFPCTQNAILLASADERFVVQQQQQQQTTMMCFHTPSQSQCCSSKLQESSCCRNHLVSRRPMMSPAMARQPRSSGGVAA